MDYKELAEQLFNLEAVAYGYSVNEEVCGMDCSDFEQLMVDAGTSITELLERVEAAEKQLEIVTAEKDEAVKCLHDCARENGLCNGCMRWNGVKCIDDDAKYFCESGGSDMWEWKSSCFRSICNVMEGKNGRTEIG